MSSFGSKTSRNWGRLLLLTTDFFNHGVPLPASTSLSFSGWSNPWMKPDGIFSKLVQGSNDPKCSIASYFRGIAQYGNTGSINRARLGCSRDLMVVSIGKEGSRRDASSGNLWAEDDKHRMRYTVVRITLKADRNNPVLLTVLLRHLVETALHESLQARRCMPWLKRRATCGSGQ